MQLITAKCPDCGAGLKIPEGNSSVTCEFCGSQVLVTDVLGSGAVMQNCMILAYAALQNNDYKEAYDHFNRALEIDMKSSGAWFGKALCTGELGKVVNSRFDEMMTMFENALKYAPADKQDNVKKNAAAEVVKCVHYISPSIKFGEDMLEIEMGDNDADMAASAADISANLKKTKDEITRALQKAQEYDPSNKDVAALLVEVTSGAFFKSDFEKESHPKENSALKEFDSAMSELDKIQTETAGQSSANQPDSNKKSGCFSIILILVMMAAVLHLLFGI